VIQRTKPARLQRDKRQRHAFRYGENYPTTQKSIGRHARYGGNQFIMANITPRMKFLWSKCIFYGENPQSKILTG
jgi:hypothetical protein